MTPPPRRARTDRPDYRNATDVHDAVQAASDILNSPTGRDVAALWREVRSAQATIKSSVGGGTKGGVSDPTANTALSHDPARHAMRRVEACASQLRSAATELENLCRVWLRQGADAATAEPEQTPEEPGCAVMARVGIWAPARVTKLPNGKGTLRLSRWAADFMAEFDRLPSNDEAERHAQGKRVYVTATRKGKK